MKNWEPEKVMRAEQAVSGVVGILCKTLEAERIDYCHWKSNAALDCSAKGDNDLDLLVGRADIQRFIEILYRLGFKEALKGRWFYLNKPASLTPVGKIGSAQTQQEANL